MYVVANISVWVGFEYMYFQNDWIHVISQTKGDCSRTSLWSKFCELKRLEDLLSKALRSYLTHLAVEEFWTYKETELNMFAEKK